LNVLLDTQICLWSIANDPRLSDEARRLLEQADSVVVSSASLWEAAIKHSMGKFPLGVVEFQDRLAGSGATFLPVLPQHCQAVAELPLLHRDPFDRMLVAQAVVEPLHLVTRDPALRGYPGSIHFV